MKNHIPAILIVILTHTMFWATAQPVHGTSSTKPVSEEEKSLTELTRKAKRSLLVLIQVGQEILSETGQNKSVSVQAQIIKDGTPVYASRHDTTSWIDHIDQNQKFDILQQHAGYLQIRLSSQENGWIQQNHARISSSQSILNKTVQTLSKSTSHQIEIVQRLYLNIQEIDRDFQKLYQAFPNHTESAKALQIEMKRYLSNANNYYRNNFKNLNPSQPQPILAQAFDRFSGQINLSTGSSTFSDQYSESLSEESKGRLGDISITGNYRIDPSTSLNMIIATRSEVLETPFKSNNYALGFRRRKAATKFDLRLGVNQYKDSFRKANSYNRINFITNVQHDLNEKNKLSLIYKLVNNNYLSDVSANYSRHNITATAEKRTNANNIILATLRGNLSASERQHLNFIHLLPSITFRKASQNKSSDLAFIYESFTYQELNLRNSMRGSIQFSRRKRNDIGQTLRNEVLLSYISYPSNLMVDHARLSLKRSKNDFTNGNTFSSFDITSKYFLHNPENSYADLRYDIGYSNKLYTQMSLFQRLYYPENNFQTSLEANVRVGLQLEGFKIGPVLSVRSNLDLMDPKFETDGSFYRLGAFVDGSRSFKNGLRLSLNGAYEYGHVFSEDVAVNSQSGQLSAQTVTSRTPITLRFSATAGMKVFKLFDLFANIDYYKIDRNHKPVEGLNPILTSDRVSFKLGISYRYN
ncbi:MAG: hypothetical protein HKN76_08795 [Saprospiraceae bacterium]|nr:hypothetical protein [Saprospiraceae bacterium]